MSAFDEFLNRNRSFAGSAGLGQLTAMPGQPGVRAHLHRPAGRAGGFLGVGLGDAIVERNPGAG